MEELNCFDKIECCECGDHKTCVDIRSLKPCPFCGKTELESIDCTVDDPCYSIQCRNCNTTVYSGNNFLEAVEMWNTRAKQPLTLREALEAIVNYQGDTFHQGVELYKIGKIRELLRDVNMLDFYKALEALCQRK